MAYVKSVKHIWERTGDSSTRPGGRTPVCRRLFPQAGMEENQLNKELQRAEDDCEDASVISSTHESLGDFDAIPEEFRPSRRGKGLMKVRTSPEKEDPQKKMDVKEQPQNAHFSNKPIISRGKRGNRNSNSSTIRNEARNYEIELLKTEESEQPKRDIGGLTSDDTGQQKTSSEMFFYSYSVSNEPTSRSTNGCQENWSEKESKPGLSKLKNKPDENPNRRFYDPGNSQSKGTNEFNLHLSFEQQGKKTDFSKCCENLISKFEETDSSNQNGDKDQTTFPKYPKNIPPKFQDRNTSNQNKEEGRTYFPKYNKKMPPKFQDGTTSNRNRASFADKGAHEITREITVEKRIKWKNDLCTPKKPENKPNFFYEYTKTTNKSVSYVPSQSEDDNGEETERPYQEFKKTRDFRNDSRRTNFEHCKQRPGTVA